ncbi:hypothetical protein CSCA_3660 [Clostridium scatologenes]|uniref:Uncharacterized protein n=1 Tax=Clostridium scatologenes TaxID=1548 RepID=A0A0E3JQC1_CLOSL|nr:hypothetical protein CSCA_3660 [Clostridium scatologenes]
MQLTLIYKIKYLKNKNIKKIETIDDIINSQLERRRYFL